jgi:hypothetical protein
VVVLDVIRFALVVVCCLEVGLLVRMVRYRAELVAQRDELDDLLMRPAGLYGWAVALGFIAIAIADRIHDPLTWRTPFAFATVLLSGLGLRQVLHLDWWGRGEHDRAQRRTFDL